MMAVLPLSSSVPSPTSPTLAAAKRPHIPVGSPVFATIDNEGYFARTKRGNVLVPSPGSEEYRYLMFRMRFFQVVKSLLGDFTPQASQILPQLYISDLYTATSPQILDDLGITHILSLKSRYTILPFQSPCVSPLGSPEGENAPECTPSTAPSSPPVPTPSPSSSYLPSLGLTTVPALPSPRRFRFNAISIMLEDADEYPTTSPPRSPPRTTSSPHLSASQRRPSSNPSRTHAYTRSLHSPLAPQTHPQTHPRSAYVQPCPEPCPPPSNDLLSILPTTTRFIADALSLKGAVNSRVLVHCDVGKSVSASIIIGYLIKVHYHSLEKAMEFVESRRRIARPSKEFMGQLMIWEDSVRREIEGVLRKGLEGLEDPARRKREVVWDEWEEGPWWSGEVDEGGGDSPRTGKECDERRPSVRMASDRRSPFVPATPPSSPPPPSPESQR